MLSLKRVDTDIIIDNGSNKLKIMYGGDGDLYFWISSEDIVDINQSINFNILIDDEPLYSLFLDLYNKILNCEVYRISQFDLGFYSKKELEKKRKECLKNNNYIKEDLKTNNLVNNGVISWRHDDQIYDDANTLNIYKEENKFRLEFIQKDKETFDGISIRFRNSGSRYMPFNMIFMDLYKKLQRIDFEKKEFQKVIKK